MFRAGQARDYPGGGASDPRRLAACSPKLKVIKTDAIAGAPRVGFDDWCPQINLFENRGASQTWTARRGARDQALSFIEAAPRGVTQRHPMVPDHTAG